MQCAFFYSRVMRTISLHVSPSALQIWTVAASQTVSGLSSTCPISNTSTGENISASLVTHWEQTAPARFSSMSLVSLPGAFRVPAAMLAFVRLRTRALLLLVSCEPNCSGTEETVLLSDSPKNTQVLVNPPGDIREGLYVNLSCVNKANPPANR